MIKRRVGNGNRKTSRRATIKSRDMFRTAGFIRRHPDFSPTRRIRPSPTSIVRYAVAGLGHIAQTAVLPAFAHAENSELGALVTGTREKNRELSDHYGVTAYHYDDLERAFEKEQIDAA